MLCSSISQETGTSLEVRNVLKLANNEKFKLEISVSEETKLPKLVLKFNAQTRGFCEHKVALHTAV